MLKKYKVIQDYQNSNEDPIKLIKGDIVQLKEKSNPNGPWANWIYCIANRTQKMGWTPIQILQIEAEMGIATVDYNAKEMSVSVGDELLGDHSLNGWLWCNNNDRESGWVPLNCLEIIE